MSPRRPSAPRLLTALLAAVVLAVLASLLGPTAPALAAPAAPAATPSGDTGGTGGTGQLHFGDDTVHRGAAATARASIAWRGSRLYYRETLSSRWDWSLRTAVAKWNASGSRITLVPTTNRRRAQVTVSSGETGGAAGLATMGRTRGAFVELSAAYERADADSAHTRVEVMNVLAHELGHVLGFDHTTTACSLMGAVLDVAGCGVVAPARPGVYGCRTIDAPLVTRLVRLYGGTARVAAPGWCLIDPLPGTLAGLTTTVSPGGDVLISWRPPTTPVAGAVVEVRHWDGSCAQEPDDSVRELVPAWAGSWEHDAATVGECLTVALVNRYGLASTTRAVSTVPQPAAVVPAP